MKIIYVNCRVKNYLKKDHRSYIHNLCSWEKKAWKKFRLVRDSNPWPLRYRCSALPIKLTSQLGAGHWTGLVILLCCLLNGYHNMPVTCRNKTKQKSFFDVHCLFRFTIAFLQYLVLVLTQPPQKFYPECCVSILPVYYVTKKFTCFSYALTFKKPSLISLTHTTLCAEHINYFNLCKDMKESLIFFPYTFNFNFFKNIQSNNNGKAKPMV